MHYYVTFRHRRELNAEERQILFSCLIRPEGRSLDLTILAVGPEESVLIFTVLEGPKGIQELSEVIEKAKVKAGKKIVKATGERFPPLYTESFDRIIRDQGEFEEKWMEIAPYLDNEDWISFFKPEKNFEVEDQSSNP